MSISNRTRIRIQLERIRRLENKMDTLKITCDFKTEASKDFMVGEYWRGTDFELPVAIINAGQILRDYFGVQMSVTNTYPDGQNFGYHRLKKAADWSASDINERENVIQTYNQELDNYIAGNGSVLIDKLRAAGITGLGRENVCIHLDVRPEGYDPIYKTSTNRQDKYGKYTAFLFICHYIKDENGNDKMVVDVNKAI